MPRLIASSVALVLFSLALVVHAAPPPLTDNQIRGFIASIQDLELLGDELDDDELIDADPDAGFNAMKPMSSSVAALQGHARYAEFESIVRNHGFDSGEQWGQTGDRVVHAFMALEMQREAPGMQAELAEALRQIENNPHLSETQKAAMMQAMEGAAAGLASAADAPQADIDAVSGHAEALRQAFDR